MLLCALLPMPPRRSLTVFLLAVFTSLAASAASAAPGDPLTLWYDQPSER